MIITVPKVGNGSRPPLDGTTQDQWPDNTGPYRPKTTYTTYSVIEERETEFVIEVPN